MGEKTEGEEEEEEEEEEEGEEEESSLEAIHPLFKRSFKKAEEREGGEVKEGSISQEKREGFCLTSEETKIFPREEEREV